MSQKSQTHILSVSATLCMGSMVFPSQALIDSGAEDNLIDGSLARTLGCALNLLDQPIPALALDGKVFVKVTHSTEPISLIISDIHHKSISFLLPWLWLHNPHTDWSVGKIVGWRAHCHAVCLCSALPPVEGVVSPLPDSPVPCSLESCFSCQTLFVLS